MRRTILVAALLCCLIFCFNFPAANAIDIGLDQIERSTSGLSNIGTNASAMAPTLPEPLLQENITHPEKANETGQTQLNNTVTETTPNDNKTAPSQTTEENITILRQDSGTNLTRMNITFTISPTYGLAQTVKFTAPRPGWMLENVLVMATDGWNASIKELPKSLPFTIDIRDDNMMLLYHYAGIQLPYFTNSRGVRMAAIDIPPMPVTEDFFVCFYGYGTISLGAELENATNESYYYEGRTAQLYSGVLPMRNNQTIPVNWLIRVAGY